MLKGSNWENWSEADLEEIVTAACTKLVLISNGQIIFKYAPRRFQGPFRITFSECTATIAMLDMIAKKADFKDFEHLQKFIEEGGSLSDITN